MPYISRKKKKFCIL